MKLVIILIIFFSLLAYGLPALNHSNVGGNITLAFEKLNDFLNNTFIFLSKTNDKIIEISNKCLYVGDEETRVLRFKFLNKFKGLVLGLTNFTRNNIQDDKPSSSIVAKPLNNENKEISISQSDVVQYKNIILKLKSGSTIKAKLIKKSSNGVTVFYEGFPVDFTNDEILNIEFIDN